MLVSCSGLLKKCRLSTGRSGRAFQIEVSIHDQRQSLEGSGVLVSMMSMHVHKAIWELTLYVCGVLNAEECDH